MADAVGLKAFIFIALSSIYVVFRPEPSWLAIFLKDLPIVYLCALVLAAIYGSKNRFVHRYDGFVLAGLVLSGIGDASLVHTDDHRYFIVGLLLFAVAHICYIYAFGLKPFNIALFFVSSIVGCIVYSLIYSGLARDGLTGLGGLYNILIMAMCWRALARETSDVENRRTWIWSAIGASLFFVSDFTLGLNKFHAPIPYAQTIIMVTYYGGQLGIALSVFGRSNI